LLVIDLVNSFLVNVRDIKELQNLVTLCLIVRINYIYIKDMIIQKELIMCEEYFRATANHKTKAFVILKTGERIEIPVKDLDICNLVKIIKN
jgi:hypothetical protein